MRTTVTLADDVAAAVEELRRQRGIGVSEAINELARSGLAPPAATEPFTQVSHDLGRAIISYENIAETLETVDGPSHR